MTRTALVTGGTGFIGSHLVRRLLADGWNVHVLARATSSIDGLPASDHLLVHRDPGTSAELAAVLRGIEIDVCFHLASYFVGQHTPADVEPLVEANVAFPTRLADALACERAPVLVNTGTAWQHVEGAAYRPAALYAATKQACHDILRYYAEVGSLRVVTLALFDTYGPGDPRGKLLGLLRRAQADGALLPMSPGEQLIDLLYVDDVVEAFLVAAESGQQGRFLDYSVGSGRAVSLRDLVALVEKVTGAPIGVEWGARPYRAREMFSRWDAGPPLPGWRPRVSLEEGIERTWRSDRQGETDA